MAIGPQLMGHIGVNYSVKYVSAAIVSAVLLLEPVGATVLGAIFMHEVPQFYEIIGGVVILVGVAFASIPSRSAD